MPKITTGGKKRTIKKLPTKQTSTCPKCAGIKLQRIRRPDGKTVERCSRCRREFTLTQI